MAANTFTAFPESTAIPFGNRRMTMGLLTGPTSYTQVTPGSPPTGGQAVSASQFGLLYLDLLIIVDDATAAYSAIWSAANPTTNPVTGGVLTWIHQTATVNEVAGAVDLSAKYLRVMAIGR